MTISPIGLTVISHTISELTPLLSRILERTVVDETGLKGNFDISLELAPDALRGLRRNRPATIPRAQTPLRPPYSRHFRNGWASNSNRRKARSK